MKLIIGLGNPGSEYEDTRHNIGFMVLDKLARELHEAGRSVVWEENSKFQSVIAKFDEVLLVKPVIFMNNSGIAVQKIVDFYRVKPEDIWVIHDDFDLPLGKIRIREQGSSAGHNGVDSIIEKLGTDKFVRFRLGIGKGKENEPVTADRKFSHREVIAFVLSRFREDEAGALKHLIKHAVEAVQYALDKGLAKTMNRFNI